MSVELWTGDLAITGAGSITAVGLSAPATAAALRAGISRLEILEDYEVEGPGDEVGNPTGARVPLVNEGYAGTERLVRMGSLALLETLESAAVPAGAEVRIFCGLAVPPHAGRLVDQHAALAESLGRQLEVAGFRATIEVVPSGRAAALQATRRAAAEARPGGPVLVAGGVDCWSDILGLRHFDDQRRLRSGIKGSGVLPGEAAAFVALEPPGVGAARGAVEIARLCAAGGSHEPTPIDQPTRAVPLSELFSAVGLRDRRPLVVTDLNGERHRVFEWMFAHARALKYEGNLRVWTPAEGIGDAGAAMGGVCLAWASIALSRGYACSGEVLVWAASDEGAREAAVLRPAPKAAP